MSKKIAILGFGIQGQSSYRHYHNQSNQITICDQDGDLESKLSRRWQDILPADQAFRLGPGYLNDLDQFDLIVRNSSLLPKTIIAANSPTIVAKMTSPTNEFLRLNRTTVIGVTGTKGKGTTCYLIEALLQATGKRTVLAGNIGICPLDVLDEAQAADVVILELANVNTVDLRHSVQVAVCLPVFPDHLNWHPNFADYLSSKVQLFRAQTNQPGNVAVLPTGDHPPTTTLLQAVQAPTVRRFSTQAGQVADATWDQDWLLVSGQVVGQVANLQLKGDHNRSNLMAALAACYDFLPTDPDQRQKVVNQALINCPKPPFRLEKVADKDGVGYINDSYSTNPESTLVALKATANQTKVLIVGGAGKGISYRGLAEQITADANLIRALIVLGPTGQEIKQLIEANQAFKAQFPIIDDLKTMAEIVAGAQNYSQPGDLVLLSPGSASFGLFANSTDRGRQFNQAVGDL